MNIQQKLLTLGEHPFEFKGIAGVLEGIISGAMDNRFIALLGHPHSLQGGTMHNKVVTTLVRTFKELNISSIRFNFRGVGKSEGNFNGGKGESEDLITLYQQLKVNNPSSQFIFAGFSFGSYVSYRAAAQLDSRLLISVAPPFHHYNYLEYSLNCPWLIYQGENDDLIPLTITQIFATKFIPALEVAYFANTGHFFHGKLVDLKRRLKADIQRFL